MNLTIEFLKERAQAILGLAKKELEAGREVPAACILGKMGQGEFPVPIITKNTKTKEASAKVIQQTIRRAEPDYGFLITDAWMRKLNVKDPEKIEEYRRSYQDGDVAKDPERIEVLNLNIESLIGGFGIIQPYTRKDGKIIYEEPVESWGGKVQVETRFFGTVWDEMRAKRGTKH